MKESRLLVAFQFSSCVITTLFSSLSHFRKLLVFWWCQSSRKIELREIRNFRLHLMRFLVPTHTHFSLLHSEPTYFANSTIERPLSPKCPIISLLFSFSSSSPHQFTLISLQLLGLCFFVIMGLLL